LVGAAASRIGRHSWEIAASGIRIDNGSDEGGRHGGGR
jgi:hypothetical protein